MCGLLSRHSLVCHCNSVPMFLGGNGERERDRAREVLGEDFPVFLACETVGVVQPFPSDAPGGRAPRARALFCRKKNEGEGEEKEEEGRKEGKKRRSENDELRSLRKTLCVQS